MYLVYGYADHAIVAASASSTRRPCARAGTTRTGSWPQPTRTVPTARRCASVVLRLDAEMAASSQVRRREGQPRLEDLVRDLSRVKGRLERERRFGSGSLKRPVGRSPGFFNRRFVSRASAPADECHVEIAPKDRLGRRISPAVAASCRRSPSTGETGIDPEPLGEPLAGSSYWQHWQYTICNESMRRSTRLLAGRCVGVARSRTDTSSHMASGSGAWPPRAGGTPRAIDRRRSDTASADRRADQLLRLPDRVHASPRTPSDLLWRPRLGRSSGRAPARSRRPRRSSSRGRGARSPWWLAPPTARWPGCARPTE